MAAPQLASVLQEFPDNSVIHQLIAQYNLLAAAVNGITTKLDADAGVTDTNYTSLWGTQASIINTHK